MLGLFVGVPTTEREETTGVKLDLDRILLFERNLEKVAQNREDLVEQIQITVKHEIGHFLGLDEEELEKLGLA